jgi:hypothetical protein
LKALGYKLEPISTYVNDYHRYWRYFTMDKTLEYLGMCVVIEHAISYLSTASKSMIQRLQLKANESEWLTVHCEEDEKHSELAIECTKNHISPETVELILSGARGDMARFVEMFIHPLKEKTISIPINEF